MNDDGRLDEWEFCVAMCLINWRKNQKPLPASLPTSLAENPASKTKQIQALKQNIPAHSPAISNVVNFSSKQRSSGSLPLDRQLHENYIKVSTIYKSNISSAETPFFQANNLVQTTTPSH